MTPGTVVEPGLLDSKSNNYLASVVVGEGEVGLAFVDITTSEFATTQLPLARAATELQRLKPVGGHRRRGNAAWTGWDWRGTSPGSMATGSGWRPPAAPCSTTSARPRWKATAAPTCRWPSGRPAASCTTSGRRRRPCWRSSRVFRPTPPATSWRWTRRRSATWSFSRARALRRRRKARCWRSST